jgi:hypothetical protein
MGGGGIDVRIPAPHTPISLDIRKTLHVLKTINDHCDYQNNYLEYTNTIKRST